MPPKATTPDLQVLSFPNAPALEAFLEKNHATLPSGFWLRLAKKSSGLPSMTIQECIEVALCYGWINGQGKSDPPDHFLARYTPRRPKSLWSKINVDMVARLTEEGRMREPGLKAVQAAKDDGRWERAYKGPATIEEPEDLKLALDAEPAAKKKFESLNKTQRYAVLWRIETTSVKNRENKIATILGMLKKGIVPGDGDREKWGSAAKRKQATDGENKQQSKSKEKKVKVETASIGQCPPAPRRSGLRKR